MLKNSFIFLPGIREKREKKLWKQGITDWTKFLEAKEIQGITNKEEHDAIINRAKQNLAVDNHPHFSELLPSAQHWRLYGLFEPVFLDIETDYRHNITMIGLYDGINTKTLLGQSMNKQTFLNEMAKYKLIVTFNGASFDLPIIERYFGIKLEHPHIDLRYVCSKLNYTGGLKHIEQELGIERPEIVQGMSGMDAIHLWHQYKHNGDEEALKKLITYNEEDIINLKTIADRLIPQLWAQTFNPDKD